MSYYTNQLTSLHWLAWFRRGGTAHHLNAVPEPVHCIGLVRGGACPPGACEQP